MSLRFSLLLGLLAGLASCGPTTYFAPAMNVPIVHHQGDLEVQAGLSTPNSYYLHAGAALTSEVGFIAGMQRKTVGMELSDITQSAHAGVGLFYAPPERKQIFAGYLIGTRGSVYSRAHEAIIVGFNNDLRSISADYSSLGLQASVTSSYGGALAGLAVKGSYVSYDHHQVFIFQDAGEEVQYTNSTPSFASFEGMLFGRWGFDHVKLQAWLALCTNTDRIYRSRPASVGVSAVLNFGRPAVEDR